MRDERSIIRGYTTFCDDIRQEIGGKLSFMGIYHAVLIPDTPLPTTLNKLCMAMTVRFHRDEPLPKKLTLKVWIPGKEEALLSSDIEIPEAPSLIAEQMPESVDGFWTIKLSAVFAPMPLNEEGYIRVRAYADDVEWKIGALQIVRPQQPS